MRLSFRLIVQHTQVRFRNSSNIKGMMLNEMFRLTLRLNEIVETRGMNVHYSDRQTDASSIIDKLEFRLYPEQTG